MMQLNDFCYSLPPELIAQEALEERAASRLLHVNTRTDPAMFHDKPFLIF